MTTPEQEQTTLPKALLSLNSVSLRSAGKNAQTILDKVSLTLHEQEILTIIGPNGAGKSSLLKILVGLLPPTFGQVEHHTKCRIGYMPQSLMLDKFLPLSVDRFLALANAAKSERESALAQLQISDLANSQFGELSGGELQRALLARAILRKPNLLVLDEPLQGVDVNGQVELYRLISELRNQLSCAVVMVSHDLHLVMAQSDTVLCLNQHICCHGHPENISQHPEYLKLFGSDAAENLAVYHHHHDHHHDLHGDVVNCDDKCSHD